MGVEWLDVYAEGDLETRIGRIDVHGESEMLNMAMFDLNRGLHCYCNAVKKSKAQTYSQESGSILYEGINRFYTLKLTPVRDSTELKGVTVEQVDVKGDGVDVIENLSDYLLTF